jgi:hypothetical protein
MTLSNATGALEAAIETLTKFNTENKKKAPLPSVAALPVAAAAAAAAAAAGSATGAAGTTTGATLTAAAVTSTTMTPQGLHTHPTKGSYGDTHTIVIIATLNPSTKQFELSVPRIGSAFAAMSASTFGTLIDGSTNEIGDALKDTHDILRAPIICLWFTVFFFAD